MSATWTLLIYRLPAQPSKHRLSVWRKLVALGAVYLQDGVCALPKRDDLDENMQYVATLVEDSGGVFNLMEATSTGDETKKLKEKFRAAADERMDAQSKRLFEFEGKIDEVASVMDFQRAEEELKRERVALLKANRIAFFGSNNEVKVTAKLDDIRRRLDQLSRGAK